MSDVRVQVDIREALDELSLVEQKLVLEYLKNEMGEDFDIPISEEERPKFASLETDVWVDVDDAINELSSWDRQSLYDELHDEFGEDPEDDTPFSGGTYSEQEFGKVLNKLWEDRWMLTNEQKARIEAITKESFV